MLFHMIFKGKWFFFSLFFFSYVLDFVVLLFECTSLLALGGPIATKPPVLPSLRPLRQMLREAQERLVGVITDTCDHLWLLALLLRLLLLLLLRWLLLLVKVRVVVVVSNWLSFLCLIVALASVQHLLVCVLFLLTDRLSVDVVVVVDHLLLVLLLLDHQRCGRPRVWLGLNAALVGRRGTRVVPLVLSVVVVCIAHLVSLHTYLVFVRSIYLLLLLLFHLLVIVVMVMVMMRRRLRLLVRM